MKQEKRIKTGFEIWQEIDRLPFRNLRCPSNRKIMSKKYEEVTPAEVTFFKNLSGEKSRNTFEKQYIEVTG